MVNFQKHRHAVWLRERSAIGEQERRASALLSPRLDLAIEAHELAAGPDRAQALTGVRHRTRSRRGHSGLPRRGRIGRRCKAHR